MENKVLLGCIAILLYIILMGISGLLVATIIYYVWNLAVSDIFSLKQITFLQSYLIGLGLNLILFKKNTKIK